MSELLPLSAEPTGGAQSLRRALEVVRTVAQLQRAGATLARVAQATGLSSSTAFRLLRCLTEERMLRYDEASRSYELGLLAFELGLATMGRSQVQEHYRPVTEEVARRTRLTTYLMANSGNDAVCLLCSQGASMIRAMPIEVGQRLPLGIGAGSAAILSTFADAEVEAILAANAPRLDLFPGGRAEGTRIRERVAMVRREGFALSAGSVATGLSGLGVPVLPRRGLLQLAVSVSAVTDQIDEGEACAIAGIIQAVLRQYRTQQGKL